MHTHAHTYKHVYRQLYAHAYAHATRTVAHTHTQTVLPEPIHKRRHATRRQAYKRVSASSSHTTRSTYAKRKAHRVMRIRRQAPRKGMIRYAHSHANATMYACAFLRASYAHIDIHIYKHVHIQGHIRVRWRTITGMLKASRGSGSGRNQTAVKCLCALPAP